MVAQLLAWGLGTRQVGEVLSALRRLAPYLMMGDEKSTTEGWASVSDVNVAQAFRVWTVCVPRSTAYNRRSLVRWGLRAAAGLSPDAAARRWPTLWSQGRADRGLHQREITTQNVLPAAVHARGPDSGLWLLFERFARQLRLHSAMQRPASLRKALVFLYRFIAEALLTETDAEAVLMDGGDVLVARLRTVDAIALTTAYARFRARRRPVGVGVLRRQIQLLSTLFHHVLQALPQPLSPTVFGIPSATLHSAVAGRHQRGHRYRWGVVSPSAPTMVLPAAVPPPLLLDHIHPPRPRHEERIHTFSAAEIRALYLACSTLFDRILMTALFTTGMRIGGFCTLRWPKDGRVGNELHATEKGHVSTTYGLSTVLQRLLQEWVDAQPASLTAGRQYCFPGRDDPGTPLSTSCARRTFHRIARRAGVQGAHVHPHTTHPGTPHTSRMGVCLWSDTRWHGPSAHWATP